MREWEPIKDVRELFQDSQIEQPQKGLLSESLNEIFGSGCYTHVVLSGGDTASRTVDVGKIARLEDSAVNTQHIIPSALDLVKILKKEDPVSLFERTIQEAIGTYEIDQDTVESVLALVEYHGLKTIAGVFRHVTSGRLEPITEISLPIALIGVTSLREAIQIGASFMKITRASEALTNIREKAFRPRLD